MTNVARAQSTWTGTTSGDYGTPGNWNNNAPPIANTESATFGDGAANTTIIVGSAITPNSWTFQGSTNYSLTGAEVTFGGAGSPGILTSSAGAITIANKITGNGSTVIGQTGSGTLTLTGAASTIGSVQLGSASGAGVVEINTGSLTVSGSTLVAGGTLKVTNGATLESQDASISQFGSASVPQALVTGIGSNWSIATGLTIGGAFGGTGGAGTLTIADGGSVTVTSPNVVTIATGSTLNLGVGALSGSIMADQITNDGQIVANFTDTSSISANIIDNAGAGKLLKQGSGTLILNGVNGYGVAGTVATTITGGTLGITGGSGLGAGDAAFSNGTTFQIDGNFGTISNNIAVAGNVNLEATAGTTAGIAGNVTDGASSGGVTKTGTGTFILSGNNTYSGATIVDAGTLALQSDGALPSTTDVTVHLGAKLLVDDSGAGGQIYPSIGSLSGSGSVVIGTVGQGTTLSIGGGTNASTTFSGAITGTGSLELINTGTLTLTGSSNNIGGNLTICSCVTGGLTISGGSLTVAEYVSVLGGTLSVTNGGTLNQTSTFNGILVDAAMVVSGAGSTVTDSGQTQIGGNATGTLIVSGGAVFNTSNGAAVGSNFAPSSQATVTGANTAWNIDGGLTVAKSSTLTIDNGGLVNVTTGTTVIKGASTLNLGTGGLAGTLQTSSLALNNSSKLIANFTDTLTLSALISGNGSVTKQGAGTLVLSGASTYTGGITLSAGIIRLGRDEVAPGGVVTSSAIGKGMLTLDGGTLQAGLVSNSVSNVVSVTANGGTFDSNTGTLRIQGPISDASASSHGTVTFVNSTGGFNSVTTLSGANTYSGTTNIVSGQVIAQTTTALSPNSAFKVNTGATLNLSGFSNTIASLADGTSGGGTVVNFANNRDATLTIKGAAGATTSFSGLIRDGDPGDGNPAPKTALVKDGASTQILAGTNTYTGGTTVAAGTLQLGKGGAAGSLAGDVTVSAGATFAINRSDIFIFSGAISGGGGFAQNGTGTTIFGDNKSYTGGTLINAGTLQIGMGGAEGALGAGATVNNGTLRIDKSTTLSIAGNITGTGAFITTGGTGGTGVTTLSGANTYSGATTVSGGTLRQGAAAAFSPNSAFTVNAGATLDINGFDTTMGSLAGAGNVALGTAVLTAGGNNTSTAYSGVLSGVGGSFVKAGSGTLTLTNASTFTGSTRVNGGTLALTASGALAGGVLNKATLTTAGTVSGGLANSGFVNATGGAINGAIANNTAGTFNVAGTVTSNNTFINATGANLIIAATGAYTLQGLLTNGGAVTVANGGQLTATAGGIINAAGGIITVAAGGTVKDDLNNASTVTNNGTYIADVATNTGSITNNSTWTGNVLSNTATIVNAAAATWTGTVNNAGTFTNAGTVTGLVTTTAGTATNNGALNGGATISGGTFTGTGSTTNLTLTGGTLAPGNGTAGSSMTVTGNLAFQSGAQYLVQITSAAASSVNVGGTATLGGATVNAVYGSGSYVAKQYTILTAGSVSGTFGSAVNTNLPSGFLPSLTYDGKHAYLNLALTFTPPVVTPPVVTPPVVTPPAVTPPAAPAFTALNVNQTNVANTLINSFNTNGGIPLVFGGLTPSGLTVVSGELPTASQQTTFDAMNLFIGLITDPFVAGRGVPIAPAEGSIFANRFADDADGAEAYAARDKTRTRRERDAYAAVYRKAPNPVFDPHWSVWAAGFGGSQTTQGNAALGSNTATSRVYGTAVGADYLFSPNTIAGFALAGGGTNFGIANGLGSGRSDLFQAGAFIRHTEGPAYITAALAYGWQDVTTNRTVALAGIDQLQARFDANSYSGRIEGGYRVVAPWIGGLGITPYAAAQFTTYSLPAYAEAVLSGASTFALSYAAKDVTASRSELGLRSDKSFAMQDAILTLSSRVAWAHNFNTDRSIAATFQALPGASFVINGAAQASESALTTFSAEMKWRNGWSAAATFEGEFSDVTSSYAGKGVVRYQW